MKYRIEKLSIFGLGYVGCVSAACFAKNGVKIIGIDKNETKIQQIATGVSPIVEPEIEQLIKNAICQDRLTATQDYKEAILKSHAALVCVGTPSLENGRLNQEYVLKVTGEIIEALQEHPGPFIVLYRSTLEPGTMQKDIIPKFEKKLKGRMYQDINVVYQPEFLREGSAVRDFYAPGKTVLSGTSQSAIEAVLDLYQGNTGPVFETDIKTAELVKMVDNIYHALKVSFGNEVGTFCHALGVNAHSLMDIFLADTQLNISSKYLMPGKPFGGSCLPKELRSIKRYSLEMNLDLPVINHILDSNTLRSEDVVRRIIKLGKKHVGFLGLSFKENTDDLRESPVIDWVEQLKGKGYQVRIYDSQVNYSRLTGANKDYLDKHIPHITELLVDNIKDVVESSECLVVTNAQHEFEEIAQFVGDETYVLDCVGLQGLKQAANIKYQGLFW